jgi:hypothetical protein
MYHNTVDFDQLESVCKIRGAIAIEEAEQQGFQEPAEPPVPPPVHMFDPEEASALCITINQHGAGEYLMRVLRALANKGTCSSIEKEINKMKARQKKTLEEMYDDGNNSTNNQGRNTNSDEEADDEEDNQEANIVVAAWEAAHASASASISSSSSAAASAATGSSAFSVSNLSSSSSSSQLGSSSSLATPTAPLVARGMLEGTLNSDVFQKTKDKKKEKKRDDAAELFGLQATRTALELTELTGASFEEWQNQGFESKVDAQALTDSFREFRESQFGGQGLSVDGVLQLAEAQTSTQRLWMSIAKEQSKLAVQNATARSASGMKRSFAKKMGGSPPWDVGNIIMLPVRRDQRSALDNKQLRTIIVAKTGDKVRLACASGVLTPSYTHGERGLERKNGGWRDVGGCVTEDFGIKWDTYKQITETQAFKQASVIYNAKNIPKGKGTKRKANPKAPTGQSAGINIEVERHAENQQRKRHKTEQDLRKSLGVFYGSGMSIAGANGWMQDADLPLYHEGGQHGSFPKHSAAQKTFPGVKLKCRVVDFYRDPSSTSTEPTFPHPVSGAITEFAKVLGFETTTTFANENEGQQSNSCGFVAVHAANTVRDLMDGNSGMFSEEDNTTIADASLKASNWTFWNPILGREMDNITRYLSRQDLLDMARFYFTEESTTDAPHRNDYMKVYPNGATYAETSLRKGEVAGTKTAREARGKKQAIDFHVVPLEQAVRLLGRMRDAASRFAYQKPLFIIFNTDPSDQGTGSHWALCVATADADHSLVGTYGTNLLPV